MIVRLDDWRLETGRRVVLKGRGARVVVRIRWDLRLRKRCC